MGKTKNARAKTMHRKSWKQEVAHNWPLYVLVAPAVILAVIFCYIPMGGLVMAFQNYKPWLGISKSEFVGWDNFRQIFMFKESYQAIINTVIIAVSKMVFGLIVPVVMALLLNEVRHAGLKKGIQTLVYLPHFLSWVTVAGMLRDILGLDGIVNSALQRLGIEPIFFLGEAGMFRQIVVISDLWKGFGFGMIVYLAAISNIDQNGNEKKKNSFEPAAGSGYAFKRMRRQQRIRSGRCREPGGEQPGRGEQFGWRRQYGAGGQYRSGRRCRCRRRFRGSADDYHCQAVG